MEASPLPVKGCKFRAILGTRSLFEHGRIYRIYFSIVNFPFLCSNIPISPAYGIYISQLIRFARACSTFNQFLIRRSLLTKKFMSQGFLQSRLRAAFRKLYGRYNDLVCQHNLSWAKCFLTCSIPIVKLLIHWPWVRFEPFTWTGIRAHGGRDRSTGDAFSSNAPDST
jgi:hypothetical protein